MNPKRVRQTPQRLGKQNKKVLTINTTEYVFLVHAETSSTYGNILDNTFNAVRVKLKVTAL